MDGILSVVAIFVVIIVFVKLINRKNKVESFDNPLNDIDYSNLDIYDFGTLNAMKVVTNEIVKFICVGINVYCIITEDATKFRTNINHKSTIDISKLIKDNEEAYEKFNYQKWVLFKIMNDIKIDKTIFLSLDYAAASADYMFDNIRELCSKYAIYIINKDESIISQKIKELGVPIRATKRFLVFQEELINRIEQKRNK